MKQFFTSLVTWLRSVYSEVDGTGSSSRFHAGLLVLFTLLTGASFGWLVHLKTITMAEYDGFLQAAGIFLATSTSNYSVNKISDMLKSKQNGNQQNGQ